MEMHWNIWNIKEGYSTYVLGGQITQGTSIHSTIQTTEPWRAMPSRRVRDIEREREMGAYCGCAGDRLVCCCLVRWAHCASGKRGTCSACALPQGLDRVVWSRVRVGRCVLSRNAVLRGMRTGPVGKAGPWFLGVLGVLITLKKQKNIAKC